MDKFSRMLRDDKDYRKNLTVVAECVNESLGIADDVKNITSKIISELKNQIRNVDYKKYYEGLSVGILKQDFQEVNLNALILKTNEKELITKFRTEFNFKYVANYSQSTNTITVIVEFLNGYIDFNKLTGYIQHEVEHFYEFLKQGYSTNNDLYKKAKSLRKSSDKLERNIGQLIYYTNNHEINAFENEAYGYCFEKSKSENYDFFRDLIQETNLFKSIKLIDNCWNVISSSDDETLKSIGFSKERLQNLYISGRKSIVRKVGLVITKLEEDN